MLTPQITYRGMDHSPAMDARILELAAKLEELHPKITRCHVVVDELDRNKRNGNRFSVHVDVHVPGHDVVASKKDHIDAYAAITDAFDVLGRQLEEEIRRDRGKVKRHTDERGDNPTP